MNAHARMDELDRGRRKAHARLLALKSPVYAAFLEMEKATYAEGALPASTKELIAVGVSVVLNCESCMQWHIGQAARCGATTWQVLEALEVGMEMGGGPATVSVRFALDVMDSVYGEDALTGQDRAETACRP